MIDYYNNNQLYYKTIDAAKIQSVYRKKDQARDFPLYGGVFDKYDSHVKESCLVRYWSGSNYDVVLPCELDTNLKNTILNGTYIFGGYTFIQYGHFITETTSRLWMCKYMPDIPVIFIDAYPGSKISTWWKQQILEILNISNIVIIPFNLLEYEIYSISKLIVPTPGLILDTIAHKEHLDNIGVFESNKEKSIKLWMSRKNFRSNSIENVQIIEQKLEDNGWIICDLEKLTIRQQLELISSAKRIAGFEGSSFHNLIFVNSKSLVGTKIDIFERGRRIPPMFDIINKQKELDASIHKISIGIKTSVNNQILLNSQELYDILI